MHDDQFTKGERGEFRGDFTRDTFDPLRNFSRVLMQQGRVQLDADWNEQVSIFTYLIRRLAADLIGPHGVPCDEDGNDGEGFKIEATNTGFKILKGHYYVNGILCENEGEGFKIEATNTGFKILKSHYYVNGILYEKNSKDELIFETQTNDENQLYLVYLDVWERHLSYIEDDYMREKALGGPDTATRAQIVRQVRVKKDDSINKNPKYCDFLDKLKDKKKKKPETGRLKARARKMSKDTTDPCTILPEAKYRGAENQLYRVEIHKGTDDDGGPTFKWSRENGSVIFPIKKIEDKTKTVTLEHLGRDDRYGLKPNDWVEIVDDDYILENRAEALYRIEEVDQDNLQVILKDNPESSLSTGNDQKKHPYLRRWDQKDGNSNGVAVEEFNQDGDWTPLEDGIEIQFQKPNKPHWYQNLKRWDKKDGNYNELSVKKSSTDGDNTSFEDGMKIQRPKPNKLHLYQTGDYWLIPARTVTGDVEWPGREDDPHALPPQGVKHHYAPLGKIEVDSSGTVTVKDDLRRILQKNWV